MEYVQEGPSFGFGVKTSTDSKEDNVGSPLAPKPKRKYVRKNKVNLELEDDETRRKRDILASVACLENIEDYVGEEDQANRVSQHEKGVVGSTI